MRTMTANVTVRTDAGTVKLRKGDALPEELYDLVTNPAAFVDSEDAEAPKPASGPEKVETGDDEGSGPLSKRRVAQLRALAARLGIDLAGAKTAKDIVTAIEEDPGYEA